MMTEYIVFAAMKQKGTDKPITIENNNFRVGFSHGDIMNSCVFSNFELDYRKESDFGFITNQCRFVSREEGADIARNAGQLLEPYKNTKSLNSYQLDLYAACRKFKDDNETLFYKLQNLGFDN